MNILVGYTGFVGSNLCQSTQFDAVYNSKNITESYGLKPDLLVYAGVPAEKFLANQYPEKDYEVIQGAIENIQKIAPKKIVLISTIDVYVEPNGVTELTSIETNQLQPYGLNRFYLEKWVQENCEDYHIIRLPGLYGTGLKKNFIYDYIHVIPAMLKEEKYMECTGKCEKIAPYYKKLDNGFYKCLELSPEERELLKTYFKEVGFSAIHFTDSRGVFQFYNLKYLWNHIQIAIKENIKVLNLATEPVQVGELYKYLSEGDFVNEVANQAPSYDFHTIYDTILGGENGYIVDQSFVKEDIKQYIEYSKCR